MRNLSLILAAAVAAGAGLFLAAAVFEPSPAPPPAPVPTPEIAGTVLHPPRALAPFELMDHQATPFTHKALQGAWSFLFFGYTHCPDICPTTLYLFKGLAQKLPVQEGAAPVHFIFVSVDPQRDTPEHLAKYVRNFHPEFIGVTGAERAIADFTRQLGIVYQRVGDGPHYAVDHSGYVVLTDPQGHWRAVFRPPHDMVRMLKDFDTIRKFVEQNS